MPIKYYVSLDPDAEYGYEYFTLTPQGAAKGFIAFRILQGDTIPLDTLVYVRAERSKIRDVFRLHEVRVIPEVILRTVEMP